MAVPPNSAATITQPSVVTRRPMTENTFARTGARNSDATTPEKYVAARKMSIRHGARSRPLGAKTHARTFKRRDSTRREASSRDEGGNERFHDVEQRERR